MCIFCKIIAGEIPSKKIFEDENNLAFLDISNHYYGHTLVIPKKHCINIFDADCQALSSTINAVQKVSIHYKSLGFDGVNVLNNNDKSAGQEVFHLHFHIIPRKAEVSGGLSDFPKLNSPRDLSAEQEFLKMF